MKRLLSISICIVTLIFVFSLSYAQMGGSKGSGMMGEKQGSMMGGQGHMEGMMPGHEFRGGMMHNMGQMSRLMQQMRDMMANEPDGEHMRKMSDLMKEMSEHILEMSKIMKQGTVTEKEMQTLDRHNRLMQENYDRMRW